MPNSSIYSIDMTLTGATSACQSGSVSDGIEGVLRFPESSIITEALLSDCLIPYTGHSLGGVLLLCRGAVRILYKHKWQGYLQQ